MQFSSFSEFVNMGGYGFYVWLSFGAATLILGLLLISSKSGHLKIMRQIAKRKKREDALKAARNKRKQESTPQNELNKVTE